MHRIVSALVLLASASLVTSMANAACGGGGRVGAGALSGTIGHVASGAAHVAVVGSASPACGLTAGRGAAAAHAGVALGRPVTGMAGAPSHGARVAHGQHPKAATPILRTAGAHPHRA